MAGIDALTGTQLDELADIRQSHRTILTTPKGTRVMRRDFGAEFDIVDSPANEMGALRLIAAAADALARWETRTVLKSARVSVSLDGAAVITTTAKVKGTNLTVTADARIGGRS